MQIFGIPVMAIVSVALTALGAYVAAGYAVKRYHAKRREREQAKLTADRIEVAVDYAASVHADLKDPELRAARVRQVAGVVRDTLKAGGVKLADQFEVSAPTAPTAPVAVPPVTETIS